MLQGQNMLTWTEGETYFNPDPSRLMAPFQKRGAFVRGKGYPEPWLLFVLPHKASTESRQLLAGVVNIKTTGCQESWAMGPRDFMRLCRYLPSSPSYPWDLNRRTCCGQ